MRVLVTGIGGFAGPVVAAALAGAGHQVHGVDARADVPPRLAALGLPAGACEQGDVTDEAAIAALVARVAPEAVVHLAGLTFVPAAERDPQSAYRINLGGTLAVLSAARAHAPGARLLVVTSADIYGAVRPEEVPVGENTPMRPLTVYGATKAAADVAAAQWGRAYGLDVVRARPFNHTGPGQGGRFVCSALARQIALIEAGRRDAVVHVGNMDPVRDFSDVRDVAAGYVALLARGRSGEAYNLCSGEGVSIAEVVALMRSLARVPVAVRSDAALRRTFDVPRLVGTHARATADTGWTPRTPLVDTLAVLLEDWRARVARGEEAEDG